MTTTTTSRRTHRLLALAATAVVPLALLGQVPAQSAPSSTMAAQPAEAANRVPRQPLDVRNLPTGKPPAVAWSQLRPRHRLLRSPAGTTTRVPRNATVFVPLGDNWVIERTGAKRPQVQLVASDGSVRRQWLRTGYDLVASDRGRAVAFTVRGGGVRVIDRGGDRVVRLPRVPTRWAQTAGLRGEDCQTGSCTVWANSETNSRSWRTGSRGRVRATRFESVSTNRGAWLGGVTRLRNDGSCSAMTRSGRVQWRTCNNLLSEIAPDRQHVLGTPAYGDGLGPGQLDVLDLKTGRTVRTWTAGPNTPVYFAETWEDSEHILVVTFDGDRTWSIVRLGLDGTMEYAVPPRRSTQWAPVWLASR